MDTTTTPRQRRRPSFASITSVVALVVALGGTSYAAVQLPKNSVGAKQIKTNAVGGSEVRNNAIRSGEVRNGSLAAADIAPGERRKLNGARAYGVFTSAGNLVAARSKHVQVVKTGTGLYCVTPTAASGVDVSRATIVATPDYGDGSGVNHIVQLFGYGSGDGDCAGFRLYTRNFDDTTDSWEGTDMAVAFAIP